MFKKIFTNDKFFLTTVVITVLCTIIDLLSLICSKADLAMHLSWIGTHLLIASCSIIIYISYKKHNKNIMKAVIGILFGVLLMSDINTLGYAIDNVFSNIFVLLDLVLIINHLVLNSAHSSNPTAVKVNQITLLLQAIMSLVVFINNTKYITIGETAIYDLLATIVSPFLFVFACASIVCVESRLDLYKAIRQQNEK